MAGDWDAGPGTDLADLLTPLASNVATLVPKPLQRLRRLVERRQPAAEQGTPAQARQNIHRHYDLSNDLFASFLDETLSYSSAMFEDRRRSRRRAPRNAARSTRSWISPRCDPAATMLEIGTGWGELAIQAAQRGARVTTVTLSSEQRDLALRRVAAAGVGGPGRHPPRRLPRSDRPVRRDRERRDDRSGRPAFLARLLRHPRPAARRRRPSRPAVDHHRRTTGCSPPATPTRGSTSTSSRAGSFRRRGHRVDAAGPYVVGDHRTPRLRPGLRDHIEVLARDVPRQLADDRRRPRFDGVFRRMWEFYLAYCEAGFRARYLGVSQFALARP